MSTTVQFNEVKGVQCKGVNMCQTDALLSILVNLPIGFLHPQSRLAKLIRSIGKSNIADKFDDYIAEQNCGRQECFGIVLNHLEEMLTKTETLAGTPVLSPIDPIMNIEMRCSTKNCIRQNTCVKSFELYGGSFELNKFHCVSCGKNSWHIESLGGLLFLPTELVGERARLEIGGVRFRRFGSVFYRGNGNVGHYLVRIETNDSAKIIDGSRVLELRDACLALVGAKVVYQAYFVEP